MVTLASLAQMLPNLWTIRSPSSGLPGATPLSIDANGFRLVDAWVAYVTPNSWQYQNGEYNCFLPRLCCFRMFEQDKTSIDEDLDGKHFQNEPKMSQHLETILDLYFRFRG